MSGGARLKEASTAQWTRGKFQRLKGPEANNFPASVHELANAPGIADCQSSATPQRATMPA
eukprot:CAMPEP_0115184696 /NCGR_PEP_ID=MMETSP0270-20121206/9094_1 /TAXON_ID=71861 /ORGANISM="Scrippsiella trochoidea, Strain CCMP3099" /LENGTH=60 /DNA_ID=CAMNT_0002597787 /DNA_START=57 /DNA_END=239 /DNA_ORIENTATION=+